MNDEIASRLEQLGEYVNILKGYQHEVFLVLGAHDILPRDFAMKFAPSAGFRNVLVHMYPKIDIARLYQYGPPHTRLHQSLAARQRAQKNRIHNLL
ncbi:MAG: DUF86 domain-containing protein [Candidatus Methanoperedens sp.]|nr:DUF86 domain-containing protein [Candidatus Methanoperedens sp.]